MMEFRSLENWPLLSNGEECKHAVRGWTSVVLKIHPQFFDPS
jgi:hypothetical protein